VITIIKTTKERERERAREKQGTRRQTTRGKRRDQNHQEAGVHYIPLHSYIWQKFNIQSGRVEDEQWCKIAIMLRDSLR